MKITIYSPDINLPREVEDYIEKKINKLSRFLPGKSKKDSSEVETRIRIEQEANRGNIYKIAAEVILPHRVVVAKAQNSDIIKGINEIREKLQKEIRRFTSKKEAIHLRAVRAVKRMRIWPQEKPPKGKRERQE
jgi:ribosomal subunit interface protein